MIRLGVISDSHGARIRTDLFRRLALAEDFDAIVFCGDGLGDMKYLAKELPMEIKCVAGNCDPGSLAPRELVLTYGGVTMLAVHGHLFGSVRYDLSPLSLRAEELGAKVALFGHTHRPTAEYFGPVLLINPGALKDGRYAVVEIDQGRAVPFLREL